MILLVVFPKLVTFCKGGSTADEADEPASVISPVALLYMRRTILESVKSSRNRIGERYTAPGVAACRGVSLALNTTVFSA